MSRHREPYDESEAIGGAEVPRIERTIEVGNGSFNRFKDLVFGAIILGAGAIIWAQEAAIAAIKQDVAVLKLECNKQPTERGRG